MSTSQPLPLKDFEVSADRGFLPDPDPLVTFSECAALESLGRQLQKLLASQQLRKSLKELHVVIPTQPDKWDLEPYRYTNRTLVCCSWIYLGKSRTTRPTISHQVLRFRGVTYHEN